MLGGLGLGLGDPWVAQGSRKGHPSVTQASPKGHPRVDWHEVFYLQQKSENDGVGGTEAVIRRAGGSVEFGRE